ncbi:MAG TPA: SDR family NAD(P)-dependent oxidoreductase [Chitinophagales bacterium]|nr:SDR family NAD(P)-dependent oxidoreductase [Chitinophagales bacterium]
MERKRILITGGSSGIGFALAKKFAAEKNNIIIVARDMIRMERAKKEISMLDSSVEVDCFSADLSKEHECNLVCNLIKKKFSSLDVLVNNAGDILCGRFEDPDLAEMKRSFNLNYWGMALMTRELIPLLEKSITPHIIFMSSIAGYTGLFGYSHYAPAKFAVTGLAECLRMELKDKKISVSVVFPPDTDTPMLGYEHEHTLRESRALSAGAKVMSVDTVAEKIYRGYLKRKFEIYCNGEGKLIRFVKSNFLSLYFGIVDGIVRKSRKGK